MKEHGVALKILVSLCLFAHKKEAVKQWMKCVFVYPISAKTNQDGKGLIIKWPCFFFFFVKYFVLFILWTKAKAKNLDFIKEFLGLKNDLKWDLQIITLFADW